MQGSLKGKLPASNFGLWSSKIKPSYNCIGLVRILDQQSFNGLAQPCNYFLYRFFFLLPLPPVSIFTCTLSFKFIYYIAVGISPTVSFKKKIIAASVKNPNPLVLRACMILSSIFREESQVKWIAAQHLLAKRQEKKRCSAASSASVSHMMHWSFSLTPMCRWVNMFFVFSLSTRISHMKNFTLGVQLDF